jgi:hypothetical protein
MTDKLALLIVSIRIRRSRHTDEPQSILAELDVAARRKLLNCEGKTSGPEALLDSGGMPILEFGQDTRSIIWGGLGEFIINAADDLVS